MKKESRAHAAMGGKKTKGRSGRKVKEMHIRPGKSGGYLIRHDLEPQQSDASNPMADMQNNTEEHVAPDMASLQSHIASNMPEQSMPEEGGEGEQ